MGLFQQYVHIRNNGSKPVVLFMAHLPPPVNGVSIMGELFVNSSTLRDHFLIRIVPIQGSESIADIGKFKLSKFLNMVNQFLKLLCEIIFFRPSLVYFTLTPNGAAFYRDLLYIFLMKLLKVKRVYHLHGKGIGRIEERLFGPVLLKWAFSQAWVILLSKRFYKEISTFVNFNNCFILSNGIPDPIISTKFVTRTHNIPPVILFLSTMMESKGPLVLLEALSNLKIRGVMFRAVFAGQWISETFSKRFFSIVRNFQLSDCVTYAGAKYGTDKWDIFCNSDIFVFPTCNEAFGLVLLEAMSSALPVVATKEGAIPDIVLDGKTGFLVQKNNPDELAQKIDILLKDNELRNTFGRAGRRRFESLFTFESYDSNMCKILWTCIDC